MKLIGPFKLIIFSILWLLGVFLLSGHEFHQLTATPDLDEINLQPLLQTGIVPITYLWMAYISLKFLIPAKKD